MIFITAPHDASQPELLEICELLSHCSRVGVKAGFSVKLPEEDEPGFGQHIQPQPTTTQKAIRLNNSPKGREFREKSEKSLNRRERTMEWRKANPDAYRKYMAEYMKNYRRQRKSGKGYAK